MKKDPMNFQFPPKLLKQINECSNGGFLLFLFDADGVPQIHSTADNPIVALALHSHVQNWVRSVEAINVECAMDSFYKGKRKK